MFDDGDYPDARHVFYDSDRHYDTGDRTPLVVAVITGGGAVVFAIGAVVYVKRRDWLRAIVCGALSCAFGYGFTRIIAG